MEQELKQNLAAGGATVSELRSYIGAKEADLSNSLKLIAEKDEALGYLKARQLAAENEITALKAESERQKKAMEEILCQKVGLETALHDIQSKWLYRVYKKVAGK